MTLLSTPARKDWVIGCPIQAVFWLEWDTAGPNPTPPHTPYCFSFHVPAKGVSTANAKLAAPSTVIKPIAFTNSFIVLSLYQTMPGTNPLALHLGVAQPLGISVSP